MKTITLRTLLREPQTVKRITRAGASVQVTDKGVPLWILAPAVGDDSSGSERRRDIDAVLDEVLREPHGSISAAEILEQSRR